MDPSCFLVHYVPPFTEHCCSVWFVFVLVAFLAEYLEVVFVCCYPWVVDVLECEPYFMVHLVPLFEYAL